MIHLNGNLLCAIDTETTGLIPGFHDIIQLSIVPLDFDIEPHPDINTFDIFMEPSRPQNIDYKAMSVSRIQLDKICKSGLNPIACIDYIHEWVNRLKLPEGKKIVPLGCNYCFDMVHLMSWMGPSNYWSVFHGHYRDIQTSCLFHNDIADFHATQIPHPKVGLKDIATSLNVEMDEQRLHDSLYDCWITAKCYRAKLLKMNLLPY